MGGIGHRGLVEWLQNGELGVDRADVRLGI